VDYFNGWSEADEVALFNLLSTTKAKFILSTWHHSDWRENEMLSKYWNQFNVVTRDHFYHNGGSIENRKSIVEALVFNFDSPNMSLHNHSSKVVNNSVQLDLIF
jgi:DNA adenine methylase